MIIIKEENFFNKNFTLNYSSEPYLKEFKQHESINTFFQQKLRGYNSNFKKLYKDYSSEEINKITSENCKYIQVSLELLDHLANTNKLQQLLDFAKHTNIIVMVDEEIKKMDKVATIIKADNILNANNRILYIMNSYNQHILYEVKDIIFANSTLDNWAKRINEARVNEKPLSPLEKFCYAYIIVKNREYKENDTKIHELKSLSRNIVSVLNSDYCVCVGFSKLLNELCSRIGIKSIEKDIIVKEFHAINAVVIDDEKYGITNSIFYSDPTSDCITCGNTFFSYLLPSLEDVYSNYDDAYNPKNLDNNELKLFDGDKTLLETAKNNTHEISYIALVKALTAVFTSQGKTSKDVSNYLKPTFNEVIANQDKYKKSWAYQLLKKYSVNQNNKR